MCIYFNVSVIFSVPIIQIFLVLCDNLAVILYLMILVINVIYSVNFIEILFNNNQFVLVFPLSLIVMLIEFINMYNNCRRSI
jgi:hypothetical protein